MQILMPWGQSPFSEDACRECLEPHLPILVMAHINAFNKWEGVEEDTRADVSAMQRGGVMHDLIVADVRRQLEDDPVDGVEICNSVFFKVYIDDAVAVRFKKLPENHILNLDGASQNTKRYYQGYGMSEVRSHCTRATCGYVVDGEGMLLDIVIASQIGERLDWSYSIRHDQFVPSVVGSSLPPEAEIVVEDDDEPSEGIAGA